jgi:hypothetical protein
VIPFCEMGGDGGVLQNLPRGDCEGPSDRFIRDLAAGGGGRNRNYVGTLEDTFACIALLGESGCGFEQPLESLRRALDGSVAANEGFLREKADLAIILLSDEDDCSASDTVMFDAVDDSIDGKLGPLSSYRCFEFGVECEPDDRTLLGPRTNCRPREDSLYMHPVSGYTSFLRGLKRDPARVLIAGIVGDPTPVSVGRSSADGPRLEPSCQGEIGFAAPAVRIAALIDEFGEAGLLTTICEPDLSPAAEAIAALIGISPHRACLAGPIRDTSPESAEVRPDCEVNEVLSGGTQPVPACDNLADPERSSIRPCHVIAADPGVCGDFPSKLSVSYFRDGDSGPSTRLVVRCEVE